MLRETPIGQPPRRESPVARRSSRARTVKPSAPARSSATKHACLIVPSLKGVRVPFVVIASRYPGALVVGNFLASRFSARARVGWFQASVASTRDRVRGAHSAGSRRSNSFAIDPDRGLRRSSAVRATPCAEDARRTRKRKNERKNSAEATRASLVFGQKKRKIKTENDGS